MGALGLFGLMVAFVEITGAAVCPTPEAIGARLRELIPDAAAAAAPRERVAVSNDGGALLLELRDADGRTIAQRRLEAAACDDLAQAAAVIIAAWPTELRAAGAPEVVLPRPPRRVLGWELDGGFVAAVAGASFAPGGELGLSLGARGGRVLGHLQLTGTGTRDLGIGRAAPAHATYTRASLALGPRVRFRPRRFRLDLDAAVSVALVNLGGSGFADAANAFDVDVGLGGGARAAVRLGPVAPYLGVHVVGWLRPLSISAGGPTGGSAPLPRYDLLFSAGIAFGNN
jgi:hypothetical protein